MTRVVFLCSGGGGNFRFVRRCIEARVLDGVELAGILSDRECEALESAKRAGVPSSRISYSRDDNRELLERLRQLAPDLIVTTFHRILDAETIAEWGDRMLNLHYSLLPAFAGTIGDAPVRQALEKGCRILGTTVHRLVLEVDSGPIVAQSALPARIGEAFAQTLDRVFRSGAVNLAGAIARFPDAGSGDGPGWSYRADVEGFYAPAVDFRDGVFGEDFWAGMT